MTDATTDASQNNNTEGRKPEIKEYRMYDSSNIKF